MFKTYIGEKVARLEQLQLIAKRFREQQGATKYFELNNIKKALKIHLRISRYFRNKDAKSNFLEEETDTLEYRNF